jgi:hypothetical protein
MTICALVAPCGTAVLLQQPGDFSISCTWYCLTITRFDGVALRETFIFIASQVASTVESAVNSGVRSSSNMCSDVHAVRNKLAAATAKLYRCVAATASVCPQSMQLRTGRAVAHISNTVSCLVIASSTIYSAQCMFVSC